MQSQNRDPNLSNYFHIFQTLWLYFREKQVQNLVFDQHKVRKIGLE